MAQPLKFQSLEPIHTSCIPYHETNQHELTTSRGPCPQWRMPLVLVTDESLRRHKEIRRTKKEEKKSGEILCQRISLSQIRVAQVLYPYLFTNKTTIIKILVSPIRDDSQRNDK
ncbi:hypothetical protein CDAR_587751 [Caerostris darwini]|uniref:Uncharacterized protein n=1 Tax=Caerostris darwini TaxID=1538125 RepID=A0AAV4SIA7_9ARAC|nr:hypothetical protein CDAR_587751 [Caerostris darwini]